MSKEALWAPGPWSFTGQQVLTVCDADGYEICDDVMWGIHDRGANARLISTAPEMAELLKWALYQADIGNLSGDSAAEFRRDAGNILAKINGDNT